jgi:tetratricopeptide (TPR) repeat protein
MAQLKNSAMALEYGHQAVEKLHALEQDYPDHPEIAMLTPAAYFNRALALDRLGRHDEAIKDWRRSADAEPRSAVRASLRLAASLMLNEQLDEAIDIAHQFESQLGDNPMLHADFGRVAALIARALKQNNATRTPERDAEIDDWCEKAVRAFERAQQQGHFEIARHRESLVESDELSALEGRPDFDDLLDSIGH